MQANRSRDTKPELAVRSAVHRRGLRYRVAARPQPELRRTADMVFRRAKVAVPPPPLAQGSLFGFVDSPTQPE